MAWTLAFDKFNSFKELRIAQGGWVLALIAEIVANANKALDALGGDLDVIAIALLTSLTREEAMGVDERGKPKGLGTYAYVGAYAKNKVGVTPLDVAEAKMDKACDKAYEALAEQVLSALEGAASDFYSLMCYELQANNGKWEPVAKMGEAQLAQMADAKWFDGQRFSDRLWADKEGLMRALRRTLTQGINLGWTLKEMANAFSNAMGQAKYVVERLIRTEMNRVQNQAILAAYKANGVLKYQYVAILDERTSEICESLDGREFLVSEAEPGVNLPPMHPNCRSSTIPVNLTTPKIDKDLERLDYGAWVQAFMGA